MSTPFLGQIELFGFGFAPRTWIPCNGQLLPIQQYAALFALLGVTYGGDGVRTFGIPNLQSRVPMGQGNGAGLSSRVIGEVLGEENHTLSPAETPAHIHSLNAISNGTASANTSTPNSSVVLAQSLGETPSKSSFTLNLYAPDTAPAQTMSAQSISQSGGQPHSNIMPYLALNFCIATQGIFPSRP